MSAEISSPPLPTDVAAPSSPSLASILSLQVGIAVVAALYLAREVLVPITVAILLSFVLTPLVDLLRRIHLGRVPSVLLSVILALSVILVIGGVIGSQVAQLATKIPDYAGTVERKLAAVQAATVDRVSALFERIGRTEGPKSEERQPAQPRTETGTPAQTPPSSETTLPIAGGSPLALVERYLSPILSPIGTLGIIVVVAIFVLLQKEDLRDRLIRLFGATDLHRTTQAMDDAAKRLSRYFLTQLAINVSFGIIIGVGLYFIGVPNFVLWGILSTLLRFVPYIGAFISAGLPLALAIAVDPGWSMAIWTAALFVTAELTASQAAEPVLYGHSTGLSPFAVIVSAIFWSWLWGPIGLILSMPLTLCLVVLGRYVERLEFLDVLLGDRPALTPIESFYQRILAGDADEAQDHAELLLKERSLSSYYDEVALKGLQLAANDAERGALRPQQLERVKDTIMGLVSELDAYEDRDSPVQQQEEQKEREPAGEPPDEQALPKSPAPKSVVHRSSFQPDWRTGVPVLCLGGKGPLDEVASAMLTQLLTKHGVSARVAAYREASREAIAHLDAAGVSMVCVSYLDIAGTPSHLRYLVQRLRRKLPHAVILIGLWPAEDAILTDHELRSSVGADYYTTTLRHAVEACIEVATNGKASAA
jgi:predicted PurR-regulated permease PerM